MWSSKYADCEKSAKGSRAHLKQKGAQLQPNDAAFSVVKFQGRGQPPLQWTHAAFSGECLAHEAMGSSAYMKQMRLQLQQKNAVLSVGIRQHVEFEQKPETWEEKWEKEISQWGKGASNGIHETHEEFVCKFREKLQEFAMILNKKYHCNFPAEYFDDYRGSFNKEEFLGIKCSNEKSRRQEADESAMKEEGDVMKIADFQPCDSIFSNSNNYGGLDQGVWSKEGLKEHIGSFREEEMMETTNQKTEMARGNKESRGLVINLAAVIENLEEGIRPSNSPINRLEEEIGKPQCKDIIAAIPGGVSHIVEASSDIAEKEVHIRENFSKQEGKGVVVNHFGKEDQCGGYVAAPKEALARIEVAADPRSHVQG